MEEQELTTRLNIELELEQPHLQWVNVLHSSLLLLLLILLLPQVSKCFIFMLITYLGRSFELLLCFESLLRQLISPFSRNGLCSTWKCKFQLFIPKICNFSCGYFFFALLAPGTEILYSLQQRSVNYLFNFCLLHYNGNISFLPENCNRCLM